MRVLYFGCWREPGHYYWLPGMMHARRQNGPWGYEVDGTLCPGYHPDGRSSYQEGVTSLHHRDGWTALAMWDTSGDPRPASCSVFLAEGTSSTEQMQELAAEHFPEVWQRIQSYLGAGAVAR